VTNHAPSEPVYIWTTTVQASDTDPGQIAEGHYTLENGIVTVLDASGKRISIQTVKPGQDPAAVARRLLREANKPADFYRQLAYPELGIA
jgi:hypothetical protein